MQMELFEDRFEGLTIKVLSGTIQDGEVLAEVLDVNGEKIRFNDPKSEKEVLESIIIQALDDGKEFKQNPLTKTSLRYEENEHLRPNTKRYSVIVELVKNPPQTADTIAEKHDSWERKGVSSALTGLRNRNMVAVLGTDGSKSYVYYPTHLGAKEVLVNRQNLLKENGKE